EGADRRRQSSARHRDEADIAPHLGIDDRPGQHTRIDGAEFRDETDAEAARHEIEDPIFALALISDVQRSTMIPDDKGEIVAKLAIEPSQIRLAIDIDDRHRGL